MKFRENWRLHYWRLWFLLKVSGDAGDGKQSECAVGLFWCLSQFERRCYIYQNRYGSCEGDMISFVAQLDSSQESCKGFLFVHGVFVVWCVFVVCVVCVMC